MRIKKRDARKARLANAYKSVTRLYFHAPVPAEWNDLACFVNGDPLNSRDYDSTRRVIGREQRQGMRYTDHVTLFIVIVTIVVEILRSSRQN